MTTMPSGSVQVAPIGQTLVQGGFSQCWHAPARRSVPLAAPRRLVVGIGVREVDALLLLHREHADPLDLRIARLVVLLARRRTRSAGSRCSARCRARRRTPRRASAVYRPRGSWCRYHHEDHEAGVGEESQHQTHECAAEADADELGDRYLELGLLEQPLEARGQLERAKEGVYRRVGRQLVPPQETAGHAPGLRAPERRQAPLELVLSPVAQVAERVGQASSTATAVNASTPMRMIFTALSSWSPDSSALRRPCLSQVRLDDFGGIDAVALDAIERPRPDAGELELADDLAGGVRSRSART